MILHEFKFTKLHYFFSNDNIEINKMSDPRTIESNKEDADLEIKVDQPELARTSTKTHWEDEGGCCMKYCIIGGECCKKK